VGGGDFKVSSLLFKGASFRRNSETERRRECETKVDVGTVSLENDGRIGLFPLSRLDLVIGSPYDRSLSDGRAMGLNIALEKVQGRAVTVRQRLRPLQVAGGRINRKWKLEIRNSAAL
jgi:hypothetical protein